MNNTKLNEYLETGVVAEDAGLIIEMVKTDTFLEILANLCVVEMLAKDYHYRAKGKAFYGEHLLADLIRDIGELSDDINEIYYMGELQQDPPFKADVARKAVGIIDAIPGWPNENGLIEALFDRTNALVGLVEKAKEDKKIASGTTAVLDEISQKALQANGFLKRVITGEDMASKEDADSVPGVAAVDPVKVTTPFKDDLV